MKITREKNLKTKSLISIVIVLLLVNALYGASDNSVHEQSPLRSAVFQNQVETVKTLITNGADVNKITKDPDEPTVLMIAARHGHTKIMKILIANGADVNVETYDGYTALMWAVSNGYVKIVKILIENGADVNIKSDYGHTPLRRAQLDNHPATEIIKILIENGADANIKSDDGDSVLIWAASMGQTEIVKLFIENGADVNIKSNKGYTALMRAARDGYIEIMKLLIDNGADVNATTSEGGYTALMRAARNGQTVAVKILIQNHADVNAYSHARASAIIIAAGCYYEDIVRILLENGAKHKDITNIPKPSFNPFRHLVQTVFGSHYNREIEAFSTYSLLLLGLISLVRLIIKSGSLLWDTLIPLIAIHLYFLNKAVELCNPTISVDFLIFYPLLIVIGISSLGGFIRVLNLKK